MDNEVGFSLIETMGAVVIGAILLAAFTGYQSMVTDETRSYQQKIQSLEFSRDLSKAFDRPGVCDCNVKDLMITADPAPSDSSQPPTYSAVFPPDRKLTANCPGGATAPSLLAEAGENLPASRYGLKVRRIRLGEMIPLTGDWTVADQFVGTVQVEYDVGSARTLRPSGTYRSFIVRNQRVVGCGLASPQVKYRTSGVVNNDAAEDVVASAACEMDEFVIGGGWYTAPGPVHCLVNHNASDGLRAEVLMNGPVGNAWSVLVKCHPVQAVAVCMKVTN